MAFHSLPSTHEAGWDFVGSRVMSQDVDSRLEIGVRCTITLRSEFGFWNLRPASIPSKILLWKAKCTFNRFVGVSTKTPPSNSSLQGSDVAWVEMLRAGENPAPKHLCGSALPLEPSGHALGSWECHDQATMHGRASITVHPCLVADEGGPGGQMTKALFSPRRDGEAGCWNLRESL